MYMYLVKPAEVKKFITELMQRLQWPGYAVDKMHTNKTPEFQG